MIETLRSFAAVLAVLLSMLPGQAQTVNSTQQVMLAGLRTAGGHGGFPSAAYASDGSLYLLYDQGDGARVLKLNAAGSVVVAQAQIGSSGDVPVALALDPAGNVYVAGTSTSAALSGTQGAVFPARADASTNSFVAKLDAALQVQFVTFLGAGRTAVAGVSATADAVFVTGITFNATFPVTANGIQQSPAAGSSENGFVERFDASGSTLVYATYLTGANGNTAPSSIVADAADNAYVAGYTSASGYPTIAALVPAMLTTGADASSGFLSKLTAPGDGFVFSTFVPGAGVTGMAIDTATQSLLLSGEIALGQFPVATAAMPLVATRYQTVVRVPVDGQSVTESVLLAPGSQTFVSAGANGTVWVSGQLGVPLFPGTSQPAAMLGDSFVMHVTSAGVIDQTARVGGQPAGVFGNSALKSLVGAVAVSPDGVTVAIPATLTATLSAAFAATQGFDLPLVQVPAIAPRGSALPNTLRDATAVCVGGGQCSVTAGYLTMLSTAGAGASLSVSVDSAPNVVVRNLGSATASGLALTASGFAVASNCGTTLASSAACVAVLSGGGPGSFAVSAANAASETAVLAATAVLPDPLMVLPVEIDFGIQTSGSAAATRTLTVTNLSAVAQTFGSALDTSARSLPYSVMETASDCPTNGSGAKVLTAGASCQITLGLMASASSANDGVVAAEWKVGAHDVSITGVTEAAALHLSASEVDFGTQFTGGGVRLPRYLYVSNNSSSAVAHAMVALGAGSPFTVLDECPSVLGAHSVCRMTLTYLSATTPSADSVTLALDMGLSVLVTGTMLPPQGVTGSTANPSLVVTPSSLTFAAVVVTGISGNTQTVVVKNTGAVAVPLTVAVAGDFGIVNGCPATLAGGSSCQVLVSFTPSQPGVRDGLLAITGGTGFAPAYVVLCGRGLPLFAANNGTLDVGQTLVGQPVVAWFKVQQSLTSLNVTTNSAAFGVVIVEDIGYGHGAPPVSAFTQSATGSCTNCYIGVQLLTQRAGTQAATLSLSSLANGKVYSVSVTGTALPVSGLLLTPLTADFGTVAVNSASGPQAFSLANLLTPAAGVMINSVSATGDFVVVANTSGGSDCAGMLASTATCFVEVTFAPSAVGVRTGTLTVVTNAGTVSAALSGSGVADLGVALNPTEIDFRNVPGSAATQQSVVLSDTSGVVETVGAVTSSDASFAVVGHCSTLQPGALCAVTVTYAPGFAPASGTLSIPVTSTVNGQTGTVNYLVALRGLYTSQDAGLEITPGEVVFGTAGVGALGVTRQLTVNNLTAKTANVAVSMPRQFLLTTPAACATLTAFGSCTFSVEFAPSVAGSATGTVLVQATPTDGSPVLQAFAYMQGYGIGVGALTITGNLVPHSPMNFGQVTSGQSAQQTLTVTNNGSANVTVRRVSSGPPFLSTTTCGTMMTPGQTCVVTMTYAPVNEVAVGSANAAARVDAGVVTIDSDAGSSPYVVELSGSAGPVATSSPGGSAVLATYSLSSSALTFANTAVGNASSPQTVTMTNTGTGTEHVLGVIAPPDFIVTTTCTVLLPGDSCSYAVQFTPGASSGATVRAGAVEIQTDAATSLEFVSVLGISSSAALTLSPTGLDFGTVNVGSSGTLPVRVTNNTSGPVTFTGVSAGGDYSAAVGTCPAVGSALAGGASCALQVTFTPTIVGTRTGTLSLSTSATTLPLAVAVTGNAVAARLQVTPGALAFGPVSVGASANLPLTLLNVGTAPVSNIAAVLSGANAAEFAVTLPCSVTTLAPNQGCTMTVTFTPSAVGVRSATVSLASSDPASPVVIALTGAGTAAGSFTLTVNGGASGSATVKSGSAATYALTVTPLNGFTGSAVLACGAVRPAVYASCSLNPSTVTLAGGAQNAVVTINTITSHTMGTSSAGVTLVLAWAWVPLLWWQRRRVGRKLGRNVLMIAPLVGFMLGVVLTGCGGSRGNGDGFLLAPAGSYQYQVTATSTSGTQITQTVTLNLTVQ